MKSENICNRDIEKFRKRIELLRGNDTQEEFCKGIGVSVRTYQNWISGKYTGYNDKYSYTLPDIETAIKICDNCKVSLDYLFGRTDYTSVDNEKISKETGLSDKSIESLKNLCDSDRIANENGYDLCVMPTLNEMLSSTEFESFIRAFRNYVYTEYAIPVYHTGKKIIRNDEKFGQILDHEAVISSSSLDVSPGTTLTYKDKKGKTQTAAIPDTYYQHFAKSKENPYDNIPIVIDKNFMKAVALKEIERALIEMDQDITGNNE